MRRTAFITLVGLLAMACSSAVPPEKNPERPTMAASTTAPVAAIRAVHLFTAADWLAAADQAEKEGNIDVANACRGKAYQLSPSLDLLKKWMDGLLSTGAWSIAKAQLAQLAPPDNTAAARDYIASIQARIDAHPTQSISLNLEPIPAQWSPALEAQKAGRWADALPMFDKAFTPESAPSLHEYVAQLAWQSGNHKTAAQHWTKARVLICEAGATLDLFSIEEAPKASFEPTTDGLVVFSSIRTSFGPYIPLWRVQWTSSLDVNDVRFRVNVADNLSGAMVIENGRYYIHPSERGIVVRETATSAVIETIDIGLKQPTLEWVSGPLQNLQFIAAQAGDVTVWDRVTKKVEKFTLEGTTPTITRVYRAGRGVYHDNILKDTPSWAVRAALSPDGRLLAVGGSDSKVRVFHRNGSKPQVFEHKWDYEERRGMGGNPDLNEPLDLRFNESGTELWAAFSHGETLVWNPIKGTLIRNINGQCSDEEASQYVNRYQQPGVPLAVPSARDKEECGHRARASFSPDLKHVAILAGNWAVRDTATFRVQTTLSSDAVPDVRWASNGNLVGLGENGAVLHWVPSTGKTEGKTPESLKEHRYSVYDTFINDAGSIFSFESGKTWHVWNLSTGQKELLQPDAKLHAVSSDGNTWIVRLPKVVHVIDGNTKKVIAAYPLSQGEETTGHISADGKTAILDVSVYPHSKLVLCDLKNGECKPLPQGDDKDVFSISENGKWAVIGKRNEPPSVVDLPAQKEVFSLSPATRSAAISADGKWVAWIEHPDRDMRKVVIHRRLLSSQKTESIDQVAWPTEIAIARDGSVVWALFEHGLFRWSGGDDRGTLFENNAFRLARHIQLSPDNKLMLLSGYGQVNAFALGAGPAPLATLRALRSGGYFIKSEAGAVEGSADAPDHLLTSASRGQEQLILSGRAGWDAAHIQGVWASALMGKIASPPIANVGAQTGPGNPPIGASADVVGASAVVRFYPPPNLNPTPNESPVKSH
ncbi:MAG: hypothetical protein IPK82_12315 [Polyangiaceae bacterium]|nr:hypothetical protein [Polyangiaceae bacterium]